MTERNIPSNAHTIPPRTKQESDRLNIMLNSCVSRRIPQPSMRSAESGLHDCHCFFSFSL
ncbi:MAG: hypothetical protein AAGA60_03390 [Cyanobacteria bacterium P01_E01_bin.42]